MTAAFLATWPVWLFLAALAALALWLDYASRDFDPYADRPEYEPATTCGEAHDDTFCDRAVGHARDFHGDRFGRRWPVEIGGAA